MRACFAREINRQYCFRIQPEDLPWILRVYRLPFDKWSSPGQMALFGAPSFALFMFYQRFWPFSSRATATYERNGQPIRFRFNSKNSQFRALYLRQFADGYEPHTTALINALVPAKGVFYDIGSNWGWFGMSLAARPDFQGQIHAFEPFGPSFADMKSVVEQTGLESVIRCHRVALGDHCGTGQMRVQDGISSGLATLEEGPSTGGDATSVATLDSLQLPPPDVMKVDVEGAELKVFRGGAALIGKHQPMIVFENSGAHSQPESALKPMRYLQELGYTFFRLAWLRQTDSGALYRGDDGDSDPRPKETLVLAEFEPGERPLLAEGLNLLACHRDKVGGLESNFRRL